MSVRALAPGLVLALALWAGEAAAQTECRGGAHTGSASISCTEAAGSSAHIVVDPGSVNIPRIDAEHSGSGNVTVSVKSGATLTGSGGLSVVVRALGSGNGAIGITGASLTGNASVTGGRMWAGNVSASMSGGSLAGKLVAQILSGGSGNASIVVSGNAVIKAAGNFNYAIHGQNNGTGNLSIRMADGSVETTGAGSYGVLALSNGTGAGDITVIVEGGAIRTRGGSSFGFSAHGVVMERGNGPGNHSFRMSGGSIVTEQDNAHGVVGVFSALAAGKTVPIAVTGGSIAVEGLDAKGILTHSLNLGSVAMTTAAPAKIASPFSIGMEGRLTNNASATGRIAVTHGGAVEARDAGVLAWAPRSSGHTMGAGATTADDAARTTPMIHVTSSGSIMVGAPVTEAFIRGRIAGADETLSAAEQAVLAAITANDSSALTTALAALPASYDAAWKAEAEDLRRKRAAAAAAATGDGPLAHAAAEEILGLSSAGVRAMALSHTAIADRVRAGDALSTAERAALTAVLTKGSGTDLEAALTALPDAAYDADWKNAVRQHALTYNAGDIHVDVTGGAIDAEGNGVEALYVVPHASNGAIAVTVAAGARVTGGAKGIYVRGAGVTSGVRNQQVTVHGAAMGGTGAGVHLFGGGAVTVGADGEVSATSGVAILGDGGGALTATVSGRVTGDIRVDGGGSLTANVMDGGVVTGTIHDPQTALAVAGSIGRILYASGGTVTVSGSGTLTGVEGVAIESAAGALTVTVNDGIRVEGDVKSGGTLTATVNAGGAVTGTIHNPASPMTVGGSVGRILYAGGGTVTVARGGAITGIAIDGATETIRAVSGDLSVTVAGRIEGGLRPSGDGALTANVMAGGVVTGTIRNPASPTTVRGSAGRILYDDGGTVTVAGGGAVTGVDNDGTTEAIRADAGDLDVTVAANGAVTGLVEGRGGGDLEVDVAGAVTGDIAERGAGDLDVTVAGTVTGGVTGEGAGEHTVTVASSGAIAGTVRLPTGAALTVSGDVGRVHYDNGGAVTVNASGEITGLDIDGTKEAIRGDAGDLAVTVHGTVAGNIEARGDGDLTVTVSETGTINGEIFGRGGGVHTIEIAEKARVLGTVHNPKSGTTIRGAAGRVLFDNGGALTVAATGRIAGVGGEAIRADAGDLTVSVASGGAVMGRIEGRGAGAMTVNVGGAVTGAIHGKGAGKHEVTVASGGMVTGDIVDMEAGDLVASVAGRVTGDIEERGAGDLTATVTGTVTGGIRGMGAGSHTVAVMAGGAVTGTVHLPTSAMTIAGRVGRVLYDNGGSVMVAATGSIAGVETGDGGREAIRSAAGDLEVDVAARATVTGDIRGAGDGDLDVEVSGTVEGDIGGTGAGSHTVAAMAGGAVTGTVHLPTSAMTVAGRVGRVLYDNGGSVTVASGGAVTGIDTSDRGREAIRSAAGDLTVDVAARATVTGAIRGEGEGDLDVDVSGTVEGGIFGLGGGEHDVHVKSGGSVEGLIRLAASKVTVDGAAASVQFDRGGTVEVSSGGRISGLDGRAVRNARGDLTVMVNGNVVGSIEDLGPGALTVAVANALTGDVIGGGGGAHRLTVASGAEFRGNVRGVEFIAMAGDAEGMLHVPAGGKVEVAAGGELVGAEDAQGRRVAVVAETGALSMTVDGMVEGAVEARDAGAASTVTVGAGGEIDGRVTLAGTGSTVEVNGAVKSVDAPRGAVTVGENGRIEEPIAGAAAVTVKAAAGESDEDAVLRVGGGRIEAGGATIVLEREGRADSMLRITGDERIEVGPAPRHRVYEALPSALLALNALPAHGDRFAAAGAPRGAFARLDAGGGERHPASSTAAARHDYRRFGFEAGIEGAAGERGVFAVSVHHVRGRADVEADADTEAGGGRIEITGTGARISGAWLPAENVYVSGHAAATLYEADLDSDAALEGALARDLSGRGYAAGVEIGRRLDLGRVALTPRAGADWSMVEMSSFTDAMGERVSLDAGRRITARAGVRAESAALPGGAGAMFATLDLERELSGAMEATAEDRPPFKAEAEATWARLGLGAAHEWADGRIALRANAAYAAARNGNRDFSGSAALTVRF